MSVECGKGAKWLTVSLFAFVLLASLIIGIATERFFAGLLCFLLCLPIALKHWIVLGRTLVFSSEGCTVKFLFFRKHYPWAAFHTMRLIDFHGKVHHSSPYTAGIEFSVRPLKMHCFRRLFENYGFYSWHSFSYFFVYFTPECGHLPKRENLRIYEVDRVSFCAQLEAWGVVVTEVDFY